MGQYDQLRNGFWVILEVDMSELMIDLMEEIERGELSLEQIASKFNVPLSWVDVAFGDLLQSMVDGQ